MKNITGNRIRKFREDLKLTQSQLGDIVHVTKQSVSKWENGINIPEPPILMQLAVLFHCSVGYLLGESHSNPAMKDVFEVNNSKYEVELKENKNDNGKIPYDLTPEQIKKLLNSLGLAGFDVQKLIDKVKKEK